MPVPGVGGTPTTTDAAMLPKAPTPNGMAPAPNTGSTSNPSGALGGFAATDGGAMPKSPNSQVTGINGTPMPTITNVSGINPSVSGGGMTPSTPAAGASTGSTSATPQTPPSGTVAPTTQTTPTQGNTTTPAAENYTGQPLQAVTNDPTGNLIGTQINPANTPNLVQANQQAYQSWLNEQEPAYQQALRQATQQAAATGSLGSGQLETSLGNIADIFANQAMAQETQGNLGALQQQFQNENTNIGQLNQQQQYQEGLQQQAINNALSQYEAQLQGQQTGANLGAEEYNTGMGSSPNNQLLNEGNIYSNQANQTTQGIGANQYANAATSGLGGYANKIANGLLNVGGNGVGNIPITPPTTQYTGLTGPTTPLPGLNTYQPYDTEGGNAPYIPPVPIDPNQLATYGGT